MANQDILERLKKLYGDDADAIRNAVNEFKCGGKKNSFQPGGPKKSFGDRFAQATIQAEMNANPAVMTASGWKYNPEGMLIQEPDEGSRRLADNLAQIAMIPLSEMGGEALLYGAMKAAPYVSRNIKATKNFISSRNYMRQANKLNDAGSDLMLYPNKGVHDIHHMYYSRNPQGVASAKNIGNKVSILYDGDGLRPDKYYLADKDAARNMVAESLERSKQYQKTTQDIMHQISNDAKKVKSGDKVALISDGSLSKDSAPLMNTMFVRYQNAGKGRIIPIKDNGAYRMIKLNKMGVNPDGLEKLKHTTDMLRSATGDANIPMPYGVGNNIYYPATAFEMFGNGGGIYIKPSHRGRFTALKKRTGKSASWFKAHGTPAQKKMATFELNVRKWKHGDGGQLLLDSYND